MTKRPKMGLSIGDLHMGSQYAPCPAHFKTSTGSVHQPNVAQEYVNECWQDFANRLPRLDFLFLGGDMIDGVQKKDGGRYLWEIDPQWQANAALELLEPIKAKLRKGAPVLAVEGTDYHDGESATWAEYVAMKMGAIPDAAGHYARAWLPCIEINGVILDIAHTQSYTTVNRGMPLEREIRYMLIATAESGDPSVHGIIRHHTHSAWVTHSDGLREAIAIPAWQIQTHYAKRSRTPNRMRSAWIGSALVTIDPTALERNDAPVQFTRLLYTHPRRERVKLY